MVSQPWHFHLQTPLLPSGGADGRIYLLDVSEGKELTILRGSQGTITALTFVIDGTHLFQR